MKKTRMISSKNSTKGIIPISSREISYPYRFKRMNRFSFLDEDEVIPQAVHQALIRIVFLWRKERLLSPLSQ